MLSQRGLSQLKDVQSTPVPQYAHLIKQLRNEFAAERVSLVILGLLTLSCTIVTTRKDLVGLFMIPLVVTMGMFEAFNHGLSKLVNKTTYLRCQNEIHREITSLKVMRRDFDGLEDEEAKHLLKVASVEGVGYTVLT
ncbi:hypothetical protein GEMRC1_006666 [Eukaryota sp. GEM-RC1]